MKTRTAAREQLPVPNPAVDIPSLPGRKIVLTGALPGLTREQAKEMIEAAGGKVQTNVGKDTDLLVCGGVPTSALAEGQTLTAKQKKVVEYGVEMMTGDDFLAILLDAQP